MICHKCKCIIDGPFVVLYDGVYCDDCASHYGD
jgi:hypothetical protein